MYLFIYSFNHPGLINLLLHTRFFRLGIYIFIHSFIHIFMHAFIYSSGYPSIQLPIHSFIQDNHLFIR